MRVKIWHPGAWCENMDIILDFLNPHTLYFCPHDSLLPGDYYVSNLTT